MKVAAVIVGVIVLAAVAFAGYVVRNEVRLMKRRAEEDAAANPPSTLDGTSIVPLPPVITLADPPRLDPRIVRFSTRM